MIDAKDDNALPAVYGGGTKDVNVGDTRLILKGGRFSKVYGGGYGKTGSTYVELASSQLEVPEVYGGGLSETKDTTVVVKSGKINGIYGGGNGKDAVVQGDTHVQIDTTYDKDIRKASIYGGGKDGSSVSAGKTRKITIEYRGTRESGYVESEVNNIEDFDLLEIGNTTKPNFRDHLTVTGRILGRIISDFKGNQYTGDVALHHSRIYFKGAESSHIRNLTKDGNKNLISIMKDANQTYPLLLDGIFTSDPQDSKLTLTLDPKTAAADGDVMLEFREQANAREEQYDTDLLGVAVEKNLAEKKENQIILKTCSVLVGKQLEGGGYQISENNRYTHYTSVAKALNKVGQYAKDAEAGKTEEEIKNGAAGTYFISIYRDNYEFTKQDYEAMLKTAEPGNDAEDPLSYVKDTTLEWCSNYGTFVTTDGKRYDVKKDLTPRTVRISGNLNFAGQNVTVRGLKLRYLNERNIFANGMPLTINYDVEIAKEDNAANYPTIYGGGNWPVDSTKLTVMSGKYRYIYGGGASKKGRVTGDTKLLLSDKPVSVVADNSFVGTAKKQSQITADGVFGGGKGYVNGNTEVSVYTGTYGWLYGGGFEGDGVVKGDTEVIIYGNANNQVEVTDTLAGGGRSQAFTEGTSAIRVWYAQNMDLGRTPIPVNLTVKDVYDFDVLQVGNVNASNTISKMTVSGKLRGRYDSTAKEIGGTLAFRNGQVKFTGSNNPEVKNLNTIGRNSQMQISKIAQTVPLMVNGTMTTKYEDEPLSVGVTNNPVSRDVLITFKVADNAQGRHYSTYHNGMMVFKEKENIILDKEAYFHFESKNLTGNVTAVQSDGSNPTLVSYSKYKDGQQGTEANWDNFGKAEGMRPYRENGHWKYREDPDVRMTAISNDALDFNRLCFNQMSTEIKIPSGASILFDNPNYYRHNFYNAGNWGQGNWYWFVNNVEIGYKDLVFDGRNSGGHPEAGIRMGSLSVGNQYVRFDGLYKHANLGQNYSMSAQPIVSVHGGPSGNCYTGSGSTLEIIAPSKKDRINVGYEIWGWDNLFVRSVKGGGDILTPLRLGNQHQRGTNAVFDPQGNVIEIFGLFHYNANETVVYQNLYLDDSDGSGVIRITNQDIFNVPGRWRQICVGNVYVDHTVTIEKTSDGGYKDVAALVLDGEFYAQGNKIIAGTSSTSEPINGTLFAKHKNSNYKMNPTWFKVKPDTSDGMWGDQSGQWIVVNGKTANEIRLVKLQKKNIILSKDGTEIGSYETYHDAFVKIKELNDGGQVAVYTLTNMGPVNMYQKEVEELEHLSLVDNSSITFTSWDAKQHAEIGVEKFGDGVNDHYHIAVNGSGLKLDLPSNIHFTFDTIMQFTDIGTETGDATFIKNGGNITFGEYFKLATEDDLKVPCKATVYGGSTSESKKSDSTRINTILIKGGYFADVYGGGTLDAKSNVVIQVTGGSVDHIYGGGNHANLDGDTTITVTGMDMSEATSPDIYGGGFDGNVTGITSVTVTAMNDAANTKFYFGDVSGYGVDATGNLTDHVKGQTKGVTIQSNDPTKQSYVYVKRLSGFTALQLGKEENWTGRAYGNFIVQVADRFDGSPTAKSILVSATDPAEKRTDTVSMYGAELRMTGEWQGRIGSVNTYGSAGITVHKKEGLTYPLILDGTVKRNADNYQINLNTTATNRTNDRVLTFTTKDHGDSSIYRDNGGTELSVQQLDGADVRYIIFKTPQRHQIFSYVTYEANDPGVDDRVILDQNVDNRTRSKKKIHFLYDPGKDTDANAESNKGHSIRGGYLAVMPKSVAVNAEEATKQLYEKMDSGFANLGGTGLGPLPDLAASGGSTYPITLTTDPDTGKITGEVQALAIDDSDDGYWYVAHFICNSGDETFSHLVDVSAPISTSADVTSYSTEDKDYIFTFTYRDSFENDTAKVPRKWVVGKTDPFLQTYGNHGISQKVYWALGDADGNALAEAEAAKAVDFGEPITYDVKSNALKGVGIVMNTDGSQAVDSSDTAKITVRVPADIAEQKDKYLWIYIKDQENNTVRYGIPLNNNQINVRVPLSVYVVALKKDKGGSPELLAPNCYIVNDGTNYVEARISNFVMKDEANSPIQLAAASNVEAFDNPSKQLALFVEINKMEDPADVTVTTTNVKSIDPKDNTTWPLIDILGPQNEDSRTSKFTFTAIYDPEKINETNDTWIKNTMSYYFTITGKPSEEPGAGVKPVN